MNNFYQNRYLYILMLLTLFILTSCAGIRLKTIPPPSPTAKLRVYVLPITGQGNWGNPHEEFVEKTIRRTEKFLDETGIYEVATKSDILSVLGDHNPSRWEMERNGWALARDIGRAVHADYVITIERVHERSSLGGKDFFFIIKIINIETGKIFEAWSMAERVDKSDRDRQNKIVMATYRDAFFSARRDMLETAIKKSESRVLQDKNIVAVQTPAEISAIGEKKLRVSAPEPGKTEIAARQDKTVTTVQSPAEIPANAERKPKGRTTGVKKTEQESFKVEDKSPEMKEEAVLSGGARLVIYDLESPENIKTVALILTEVLREEFFRLKHFTLVNRETLQQILSEMTLQQTGLIDERQAVKAGKGLAANQVVTGKIGMLGKTYILQAKRIDVETFATLGFASTKFIQGQEEDVLSRLPGLAKSLAGLQQ